MKSWHNTYIYDVMTSFIPSAITQYMRGFLTSDMTIVWRLRTKNTLDS